MKKLVISVVILTAMAFWGTAEAQTQKQEKKATTEQVQNQTARPGFVDANGDGICDNYDGKRPGKGLGPGSGNGQGRTDGKGLSRGKGKRDGQGQGQRLRDGSGPRCNQGKVE